MVLCVIFHKSLLDKETIVWRRTILTLTQWKQELECHNYFSSIQKYSYCNLVLYVARGCHGIFSYVDATNICSSIPFHLATWTMFHDIKSTHHKKYYYLKDLKHVYFTCWGLLYGKEGQTLFIDNESSKDFQISKCNGFFIEFFKGNKLPKSKV
jgi:hypothetical protein